MDDDGEPVHGEAIRAATPPVTAGGSRAVAAGKVVVDDMRQQGDLPGVCRWWDGRPDRVARLEERFELGCRTACDI